MKKKIYKKIFFKYFCILFFILLIITTSIFTFLYKNDKEKKLTSILENEIKLTNLQKKEFILNLHSITSDLLLLKQ